MNPSEKDRLRRSVLGELTFSRDRVFNEFQELRESYRYAKFRGDGWGIRNTRNLIRSRIRMLRLARYTLEAACPDHMNARAGFVASSGVEFSGNTFHDDLSQYDLRRLSLWNE